MHDFSMSLSQLIRLYMQCVQKEQLNERIREKSTSAAYGDPEYVSDLSRGSGFGLRITGEKLKEERCDKSWYNSANGKILSQRNGLDLKHGVQSLSQNTANSDAHPQPTHSLANRSSTLMDRSWQSSDEEEYMWDDVNSADKDQRASEDSYKSVSVSVYLILPLTLPPKRKRKQPVCSSYAVHFPCRFCSR